MPEESLTPRFQLDQSEAEEGIAGLFDTLRLGILKHPLAARRLFSAFVAEGRRFATTPEGQEWKVKIESSPLLPAFHEVFDSTTHRLLVDEPDRVLPSTLLDAFFTASLRMKDGIENPNPLQDGDG